MDDTEKIEILEQTISALIREKGEQKAEIKKLQARLDAARKTLKQYAAVQNIGGPAEELLDELDKE